MPIFSSLHRSTSSSTNSSSLPFTIDFPGQKRIHTAGSVVRGVVHVDPAACEKEGIKEITVKLRVEQRSTFYRYYGGNSHDYRQQTKKLYSDEIIVWTSELQAPLISVHEDPELSRLRDLKVDPDEKGGPPSLATSSLTPSTSPVASFSNQAGTSLSAFLPFSFPIPNLEEQTMSGNVLPPSLEGGRRVASKMANYSFYSRTVGWNKYFIKVTGSAPGLKRRRRQVLPFIYLPPRTTIPAAIPPTLVPVAVAYEDDTEVSLPAAARARPSEAEGWKTYTISKEWREGMFSKKKKLVFKLALPSLPAFSSLTPVPYHLSLLLLSPSTAANEPNPSPVNLPSTQQIGLFLIRELWTTARGASQTVKQTLSQVGEAVGGRVWYGEGKLWDEFDVDVESNEEEGGKGQGSKGKRWGVEIVMVGEMVFDVVPSFERIGCLAVNYRLDVRLPLKGLFQDLDGIICPCIKISSNVVEGKEEEELDASAVGLLPPSYFDVVDGDSDDDEGEKDKKL
ncbi:hypothetical protein BDY24DRAFT_442082 [Mrakia frigida]|uniref:uncharacterized protein n=1 Tax=Mrakia frigida TaxID=29902 RepID=UPI003FCC2239